MQKKNFVHNNIKIKRKKNYFKNVMATLKLYLIKFNKECEWF